MKRAQDRKAAVAQEHPLGCGVACVAWRSGKSYQAALSLFAHEEHAWTRGFYCREVVDALRVAGFDYTFEKYDASTHGSAMSMSGTIVFIGRCSQYPEGHYLIRGAGGWMNPWSNFPSIKEVRAAFESELPGQVAYVLFEKLR